MNDIDKKITKLKELSYKAALSSGDPIHAKLTLAQWNFYCAMRESLPGLIEEYYFVKCNEEDHWNSLEQIAGEFPELITNDYDCIPSTKRICASIQKLRKRCMED